MINSAGSERAIARQFDSVSATVATSAAASTVIDVRHAAGLQLLVPAGAATQAVAVHSAEKRDGTFLPLVDSAGNAVSISTVASNAYDVPEAVFSCGWIVFVAATTAFTANVLAKG